MSEARRAALPARAAQLGLPIVEDNPYRDLWINAPPPPPLSARNPDGCLYLGSFSRVLAPGLRLGFPVAPKALYPKPLQARQAADLHSPGWIKHENHTPVAPSGYAAAGFKSDLSHPGQVTDRGLWPNLGHPNYFGGLCVWWGFDLVALSAQGWWAIASILDPRAPGTRCGWLAVL